MENKTISIIGIVATVVGMAASVASNWVNDKKLDSKISEEVTKALAEKTKMGS